MSTISAGVTVPTALNLSGDTTGALTFQVSGTVTAATISAAGNFGIGTASPGYRLDVASSNVLGRFTSSTAFAGTLFVSSTTTGFGRYLAAEADAMTFGRYGVAEQMRIDSSGNVGIGRAPNYKLDAYLSGTGSPAIASSNDNIVTVLQSVGSSQGNVGTITSHPLVLLSANAERMRIDSSGNVGIGRTPAASTRFTVKGSNNGSGTFSVYVENSTPTEMFKIRDDGVFYTGLAGNSPYNLTTGSAANVFVDSDGILRRSTSSLRYKSNVTDAAHGLADVLKLRSVTYKGKNDSDTVFGGLIAEEVHDAGLTEFVAYDNEGQPDALHYGNMVALAFKAIQELKAENDALKARIEALEIR